MYNLIFAKSYSSEWNVNNLTTAGLVSLSAIDSSSKRVTVPEGFKGAFDLVLGRANDKGGPVILPLHTHALRITHGDYQAPKNYTATLTIPATDEVGEISVVITKKGVAFNERNNWTVSFPVKGTMALSDMADKIVAGINGATYSHGLTATKGTVTDESAVINLEASEEGVSYSVQGADLLSGLKASVVTDGIDGFGTLEQIKKIASMAAADAGFEYTFKDGADLLYPQYPLNPLRAEDEEDEGFSIVTIRCGEPRSTKTHDEVVYQTVFVVFPTSAAESEYVKTFVDDLKKIGRITSEHSLAGSSSSSDSGSGSDSGTQE